MADRVCSRTGLVGMALTLALGAGTAMAQAGGNAGGSGSAPQQQQQPGSGSTPGGLNSPGGALNANGGIPGANGSGASLQDKDFLRAASQGGMFEIQAGQLASEKGNSDDVKQFGQMMVTDHTKLNDQMKPVLAEAGVKPPAALPGKEKKEYAKLQGLSGDAFDKEYITAMVKDHEEDKKAFQTEASNGQLPDEKSAAAQGAAVVDAHLQKIRQIAQAHNVSTGGM